MRHWEACEKTNNPIFSLKLERRNDAIIYRCNPSTARPHTQYTSIGASEECHHHPHTKRIRRRRRAQENLANHFSVLTWQMHRNELHCEIGLFCRKMHQLMWINRMCWPNFYSLSEHSVSTMPMNCNINDAHREQPSGMGTCTVERFLFTLNTVLCMRHKTQSQNSTKPTSATHIEESVSLDFTAISVNDLCVCVCCMSIALRALFV